MISEAMEICCRSTPRTLIIPNVMARVIGIESAIRNADRHPEADQRDEHDQRDRLPEAAHEEVDVLCDLPRLIRRGAKIRSSGSCERTSSSLVSTAAPNSPIFSPAFI